MKRSGFVLAALAAVVLSACGGDLTAKYRSGAQIAGSNFSQSAQPALSRLQDAPSTPAKIAAVKDFKIAVDQAAGDFAKLDPPSGAKGDNAELVARFQSLSRDLASYQSALQDYDAGATRTLADAVQRDFARIETVSTRLNRDVGA